LLHGIRQLEHCRILGRGGTQVGTLTDTYFDDETWVVRYLIVETGDWLYHHQVLISPLAVTSFDWDARALTTALSRARIESSPGVETQESACRSREGDDQGQDGYPWYFAYTASWVWSGAPSVERPTDDEHVWAARQRSAQTPKGRAVDADLYSAREVMGYRIEAQDGTIGHLADFLFDPETWAVCFAVVHIRNRLRGQRVLISPEQIRRVDCSKRRVWVDMRRDAVRDSPGYAPDRLLGKGGTATGRHTSTSAKPNN